MKKFLRLNNFRNYSKVELEIPDDRDIFVLYGKNGEGKTNILEALSLFSGSRGLRHSKSEDITKHDQDAWGVTLSLHNCSFSCGYQNGRKIYRVSDKNVRNLDAFLKNHYVLWLTYETDRLFVESPANRRDFIDMFTISKNPAHADLLKMYEKLTKERMKILKKAEGTIDASIDKWLKIIEEKIVETGLQIASNRIDTTERIEEGQEPTSDFPQFTNKMTGSLEEILKMDDFLSVYKDELLRRREKDFFSNSTTLGPNRSDWEVFHVRNNISATKCSAGEQKMITLGVFLCFVRQNIKNDSRCLVLLLDDVIAHLDVCHREILFRHIKAVRDYFKQHNLEIMIWLSGTDKSLFEEFNNAATFFEIKNEKAVAQQV